MTIETTHDIDELVWVMDGQKPRQLKVRQVSVTIDKWHWGGRQSERYFLASGITSFCHNEWYDGEGVFKSKEALLQSL